MNISFPRIETISASAEQPFWSVMVPTFNSSDYLKSALQSVLCQDPGPELMQIEVVDDCSTTGDAEQVVNDLGHGRIAFYRQPRNLGISGSWNACIERAQGRWIHILHQDDLVLPGFYSALRSGIEEAPQIGAAFCRNVVVDERGHWQILAPLQQDAPGILENWLTRIAVEQRIQAPSIVVSRSVYEHVGGFHADLFYTLDWEMWRRVATYYPMWYEPRVLACYRTHSTSTTSQLEGSGCHIAEIRRSIDISRSYLPKPCVALLSQNARQQGANMALSWARTMLIDGRFRLAMKYIIEGIKCRASYLTITSVVSLLIRTVERSLIKFLRHIRT